jgi:hypothetical protein
MLVFGDTVSARIGQSVAAASCLALDGATTTTTSSTTTTTTSTARPPAERFAGRATDRAAGSRSRAAASPS